MTTLAIIDDHPVYRDGLAQALAGSSDLTVLGAFESVDAYLADPPGVEVVLLDYRLPGLAGPPAVRALTELGAAVLMLSADIAREAVLDTLAAGARGYLGKHADVPEIIRAIATVVDPEAGTYVSATLAKYLLDASEVSGPDGLALSVREQQVLGLVASGERDRDIADQLFISLATVRSHLDHIRTKTGHRRRAELTRYAMEQGLMPERDGGNG